LTSGFSQSHYWIVDSVICMTLWNAFKILSVKRYMVLNLENFNLIWRYDRYLMGKQLWTWPKSKPNKLSRLLQEGLYSDYL